MFKDEVLDSLYTEEEKDEWRGRRFIAGGNATAMIAGIIRNDSNSGCPRKILLRNHRIEPPIDAKSKAVFANGFAWEDYIEESLKEKGVNFVKEARTKHELNFGVNWTVSADFIVDDTIIIETKSVNSPKRAKEVFVNNEFKYEHAVQLCSYMMAFNKVDGILMYGYMCDKPYNYSFKGKKVTVNPKQNHQFVFFREGDKFLWIHPETKKERPFIVRAEHIYSALKYISWVINEKVHDCQTPVGFSEWFSPCDYCAFKTLCKDLPESFEDFIKGAEKIVAELQKDIDKENSL